MRFTRRALIVGSLISFWSLVSTHASQKPVFSSQTDLVLAYASVRDSSGQFVSGLRPDSFEVRDNGQLVDVAAVAGDAEPEAVSVILSFGALLSENGEHELIEALKTLIRVLRPDDRAWIGNVMGRQSEPVTERGGGWGPGFLWDWRHTLPAIGGAPAAAERPMWDAVDGALVATANSASRKLIVAVTGGDDDNKYAFPKREATVSSKDVAKRFERMGAALYELKLPGAASDAGLGPLVKATGGRTIRVSHSTLIGERMVELMEDMRHAYLVGFSPSVLDGKTHSIQIKCRVPGTTVRSRTQYVANLQKSR
jgi:hypothetical protein